MIKKIFQHYSIIKVLLLIVIFIGLVMYINHENKPISQSNSLVPSCEEKLELSWIFEKKIVLSYLLIDQEDLIILKDNIGLTEKQIEEIATVVKQEKENISFLYRNSQAIAKDTSLSLEERKKAIENMKYNERIVEIIKESVQKVKEIFKDQEKYNQFLKWIEEKWLKEQKSTWKKTTIIEINDIK